MKTNRLILKKWKLFLMGTIFCASLLTLTPAVAIKGGENIVLIYGLGLGGGNLQKVAETDPSMYFANNLYLGVQVPLNENLKAEIVGKTQLSLTKANFLDLGTFIECKFYHTLD